MQLVGEIDIALAAAAVKSLDRPAPKKMEILRNCSDCLYLDSKKSVCAKYGSVVPIEFINKPSNGCPDWEDDIPF